MTTVTVDDRRRVRLPDAKPGQVFSIESRSDGAVTLTPIKAERNEGFPPGSLLKYFTPEKDEEESKVFAGCAKLNDSV